MKLIQGNLIEAFKKGEVNVIAHQCNVCCGMGAGIAKTIAKEFGFIEILDKGFRRESNLGRALMCDTGYGIIFNLYAQRNVYMSSGDDFETRLQWLKDSIKDMMDYCNDNDVIGIPLLGSGLAADKNKKGNLTDLEYFQKFIQPEIEHLLPKAVAYYL